jgi:hypothetical protein
LREAFKFPIVNRKTLQEAGMKKAVLFTIVILTVVLVTVNARAEQWQIVGPRALGMGGANVAVVNDATAQYWNPGAFGFFDKPRPGQREKKQKLREEIKNEQENESQAKDQKDTAEIKKGAEIAFAGEEDAGEDWNGYSDRYFGIHLHAGGTIQLLGDVVDEVDDIVDKNFEDLFAKAKSDALVLTVDDIGEAIDILNEINDLEDPDQAVVVQANSGLGVRIGHCAVGAYVLGELATNLSVDLQNVGFTSGAGGDAIDALSTDVLGAPIGDSPGGLTPAQRTSLIDSIDDLPGWSTAEATLYVDASDLAISNDGRDATSEDEETILILAQGASNLVSGTVGTFDQNQTSITFVGPAILEVPLSYGYAINDYWSLGGNIKYMHGKIYYTKFTVFETDSDDFLADAQRESEESDYFGIDLGTLIRFSDFRIGFVGRNLNEPRFDYLTDEEEEKTWRINPQARAGIAYMPCNWFTLAADADLTRNKTTKEDYHSQLVSTGVEFNIYNFLALRGGFYTNVGDSTDHDDIVYTAGLGLNFWGIHLDAGVAFSDSRSELDHQTYPDETRGQLAVSAQF